VQQAVVTTDKVVETVLSWPATTQLTARKFVSKAAQKAGLPPYNLFTVNNLCFCHGMEEVHRSNCAESSMRPAPEIFMDIMYMLR
jgi:hypothetical protein